MENKIKSSHYSKIYTYDKELAEWNDLNEAFQLPDGPKGTLKREYMESINKEHPVWATETPKSTPSRVQIDEIESIRFKGDNFKKTKIIKGATDLSDRENKVSPNFAQMLEDYYNKAVTPILKKNFFNYGGLGRKWSKNNMMMEGFKEHFDWGIRKIEEAEKRGEAPKLGISDKSINNYPPNIFQDIEQQYRSFCTHGPSLSYMADVFYLDEKTSDKDLMEISQEEKSGVEITTPMIHTPVPHENRPTTPIPEEKRSSTPVALSKEIAQRYHYMSILKPIPLSFTTKKKYSSQRSSPTFLTSNATGIDVNIMKYNKRPPPGETTAQYKDKYRNFKRMNDTEIYKQTVLLNKKIDKLIALSNQPIIQAKSV